MLVRFAACLFAVAVLSQACNKAQRYEDERTGGTPAVGAPARPDTTIHPADTVRSLDTTMNKGMSPARPR